VYALYHDDDLYYVGLASDLSSRLKAHLGGKHAGQWNRFSVYLTIDDKHLREKVYASPSAAGEAATRCPVDGWSFWKYERAPGDWVRLDELRR
jgi:hypothetical protein